MRIFYITFRSVTYAQRGERILQGNGIRCTLRRTPRWMEQQGCGYCLRLGADSVRTALQQLQKEGIPYRKVYLQGRDRQLEEMTV